jgi:hypothetical protein
MKLVRVIPILVFALIFCSFINSSSEQDCELTEITYSYRDGGKRQRFEEVIMTSDSIIYTKGSGFDRTAAEITRKKMPAQVWKKIIKSFSLKQFKKYLSTPSTITSDGRDVLVTVTCGGEKYQVLNNYDLQKSVFIETIKKNK